MKSKLQKRINQAERLIIIGPQPLAWKSMLGNIADWDKKKTLIIYVDGGTCHKKKMELKCSLLTHSALSVGDNDSSKIKLDIIKTDQQVSDLRFVLDMILDQRPSLMAVKFYGFTAQSHRVDHFLVNLGEILRFQKALPSTAEIVLDDHIHFLNAGSHSYSIHSLFSLLSLKEITVSISGQCLFPFAGKIDCLSSQGLSNVGNGMVNIKTKGPCLLILNKK